MQLSSETLEKIDRLIPRYPEKRSAALPLLHLVQEEKGHVSPEAVEWIAGKLDLEPINIYELLTFYPMLRDKPAGRYHIKICRTLPCALGGAYKTCRAFEEALDCKRGATTADGSVTIEFVECHADCGRAPVVMVGEDLYENVDEDKAREMAEKMKKGEF
jgi:NADH-quinone oxidoreductase subunit E